RPRRLHAQLPDLMEVGGSGPEPGTGDILESEFASVRVRVDRDANGPRLLIEDLRTGHVGYLDPLELETLAWLPEPAMQELLDPSAHRWRDAPAEPRGLRRSRNGGND